MARAVRVRAVAAQAVRTALAAIRNRAIFTRATRTARAVLQQLELLLLELYKVKQRVLLEQHTRAILAQATHTTRAVLQQLKRVLLKRVLLKLYCPSSTAASRARTA